MAGGKRPGAGRPLGSKNRLPVGTVAFRLAAAVAERRLGPGSGATAAEREVLTRCYERVAQVLEGEIPHAMAAQVLAAARIVADALAGPQQIKVQVTPAEQHAALVFATVGDPMKRLERIRPALQVLDPEGAGELALPEKQVVPAKVETPVVEQPGGAA